MKDCNNKGLEACALGEVFVAFHQDGVNYQLTHTHTHWKRRRERQADKQTSRQTDKQTSWQTDKLTNRQIDKQRGWTYLISRSITQFSRRKNNSGDYQDKKLLGNSWELVKKFI